MCKRERVVIETVSEKVSDCVEERFSKMSVDELKDEVKRLRMSAMNTANRMHDLAEEGLPAQWELIPEVAKEAYIAHRNYYIAKKILEDKTK